LIDDNNCIFKSWKFFSKIIWKPKIKVFWKLHKLYKFFKI